MRAFKAKNLMMRKLLKLVANLRTPLTHDYAKWDIKNRWLRRAGINVAGEGVAIDSGFVCLTGMEDNLHIDAYAAIGANCHIWNFNEVRIGKFCMFAADVTMTNGGHDKNSLEPFSAALSIGNGCWIGNGARIIGPLSVGDNAIIGAGAVVVRDVAAGSIVAGVPARVIGQRQLPSRIWHLGNVYFNPVTFTKDEVAE